MKFSGFTVVNSSFVCYLGIYMFLGVVPQLTDVPSCIGDTVVYNCSVNAPAHAWNISQFEEVIIISRANIMVERPPYTLEILSDDGTRIITSYTVLDCV